MRLRSHSQPSIIIRHPLVLAAAEHIFVLTHAYFYTYVDDMISFFVAIVRIVSVFIIGNYAVVLVSLVCNLYTVHCVSLYFYV